MEQVRVLLIDDDEDDYLLTKGVFDKISIKYALSWVDSYEKGINAINKKQYDVYLVDYRLGRGTGLDLLEEAVNSGCEQPVIILTGKGDITIDEQAMNIGAADYLVKDEIDFALVDRTIRYSIKQANTIKALKDSERKYKAVFEQANDPILISDFSGMLHDVNSAGLKFFDYQRTEFLGLQDINIFKNAAERAKFVELLEENGTLKDFECELTSRDGTSYFCSLSSFIHMDLINVSEVYHTIVRDLSDRKYKEEQSVSLGKMYISEHIAKGIGEEIRDPLSTIYLAIDELGSEKSVRSNEAIQSSLDIIKGNCDRVTQLMQNFISSTETKNLNLQRHQIAEVIEESIADLSDLISGHNVELRMNLSPKDMKVLLDKPKIKEALKSIVKNSIEAMHSYPKQIEVSCTVSDDKYEIRVADNGTGVDPRNTLKIFEPFFTTKKRANGLGLTHAQRVLTTHNGTLEFKNLPEGSLFIIHIPIYHEGALWF